MLTLLDNGGLSYSKFGDFLIVICLRLNRIYCIFQMAVYVWLALCFLSFYLQYQKRQEKSISFPEPQVKSGPSLIIWWEIHQPNCIRGTRVWFFFLKKMCISKRTASNHIIQPIFLSNLDDSNSQRKYLEHIVG